MMDSHQGRSRGATSGHMPGNGVKPDLACDDEEDDERCLCRRARKHPRPVG